MIAQFQLGEIWESTSASLVMCLMLAGVLVYFGIHIIGRRVIFVDLALAQLTALGAVYAEIMGWEIKDGDLGFWICSFGAGVVGALFFSLLSHKESRIPREATVGIVYVVAMAATILLSMNLPKGMQHATELMSGNIAWVTRSDNQSAAYLFAGVGLFHVACWRRFVQASFDPEALVSSGGRPRLWNFLFYCSFALVVASSVAMAGVLLVFAYLVMPAVLATLYADSVWGRLLLGWSVGSLVSALGIYYSYVTDLPTGPTVVLAIAVVLCLGALLHWVRRRLRG
jgi:zinc/manganese transport system permease protein